MSIDLTKLSDEEFDAEMKRRNEEKQKRENEEREAYEAIKIDTIHSFCQIAKDLSCQLADFKQTAFESLQTMYSMLQEYSSRHADGKGSFRIEHGNHRITYKRQGKASFDERADQAEKHIIDFVNNKFADDPDTKDLIMSLLERKKGDLDVNLIQKLYAMENRFDDQNWKKGISLLKESYQYNHSKDYIRFEERDDKGEWHNINLQFSNI